MNTRRPNPRPLSVAPMLDWTDRHYRRFLRAITRHTLLYTEMVTSGAILHGDQDYLLGFDPVEHPIALQLGGDDPTALSECARIAEARGYDEVNLNVGCPSERVQKGSFGACLMGEPALVADCVAAMRAATGLPVTVKHRIAIAPREEPSADERRATLDNFVQTVASAGADAFIVHARVALLEGLSPKQNRTVPPLHHDEVHALKARNPDLPIEINGEIRSVAESLEHLRAVDGVMLGRAAYTLPYLFATADRDVFGDDHPIPTRREVVESLYPYAAALTAAGQPVHRLTRHMIGLFAGQKGARAWRRYLSGPAKEVPCGADALRTALEFIEEE